MLWSSNCTTPNGAWPPPTIPAMYQRRSRDKPRSQTGHLSKLWFAIRVDSERTSERRGRSRRSLRGSPTRILLPVVHLSLLPLVIRILHPYTAPALWFQIVRPSHSIDATPLPSATAHRSSSPSVLHELSDAQMQR